MASRCYAGQQVYKTTRLLVGRQPVDFAGIMELRIGRVGSQLTAHSPISLYTLSAFYTLQTFALSLSSLYCEAQAKHPRQPVDFAGITDLWNYGQGEPAHSSQLTAHCSQLIAQSLSILSLPSIPFRLLPLVFRRYTAKHKRSIRGSRWTLPELRIYGTTDRASRLIAHSPITLYTLSTFYTLQTFALSLSTAQRKRSLSKLGSKRYFSLMRHRNSLM